MQHVKEHIVDVTFAADPKTTAADLLIVGAGDSWSNDLAALDATFGGHLLPLLKQKGFSGKPGSAALVATLGKLTAKELLVVGTGDGSADALMKAAAKAGRQARDVGAAKVAVDLRGSAAAIVEAFSVGNYSYDKFKPEADRTARAETLVLADSIKADTRSAAIRAKWQDWCRDLVNGPAAEVDPQALAAAAREVGKLGGCTVEIKEYPELVQKGYVGIAGVGQGSEKKPIQAIVRYRPKNAKAHIAFVGKGVTFDSGGLSLKPSNSMQTMRCDMGGAASVLAATAAIAELGLPVSVSCFIGAVENMNGGNSYKLGDIFAYRNGVTCEIHNTDAEGRLVLADCLIDASNEPGVTDILDLATLTGAIVVALGSDFTGVYTPNDELAAQINAASASVGELVWRMPLHEPYKAMLKGDWGQIKNITGKPDAGSGTAALFLQYFVDSGKRWAHLDIAGTAFYEKPSGPFAAGATGLGVRALVEFAAAKA